jgi:hypothetical protein
MIRGSAWATDYRNAEHWPSQIRGVSFAQVERMATHLVAEYMWGATPCIKCRAL